MPIVEFKPSGKAVEIVPNTELLDAIHKVGIDLDAACGGKGTCGKCIVRIVSGEVQSESFGHLSATAISKGYVLACKSKVIDKSVSIEIPQTIDLEGGQFLDETENLLPRGFDLSNKGDQSNPLILKKVFQVSQPQLEDGLSDLDRLSWAVQSQLGKKSIYFPLPIIQQIAEALRKENGEITAILIEIPSQYRLISTEAGDSLKEYYGLAIDVGTTTVALQLVDLSSGKILTTRTAYNDQINCGLDIISRINYAQKSERLEELRQRVLKSINQLVFKLCQESDVSLSHVYGAVIAGNTTMIHLLLGLPPEYIRLEPYTPTVLDAPYLVAGEVGIEINPLACIFISPAVGSYVGGDITAGILCTDFANNKEEIDLFIDIGTNGELVIGNRDFLISCACSAGPAFEGGGIQAGMRAAMGAIEKVEIDCQTGMPSCQTIGNVKPKGICGTGMISLLANLLRTGWIDPAGKLNRNKKSSVIQIEGRKAFYVIVSAKESATGRPIIISEADIDNIIRAKAAIYSACSMILEQVGLTFEELNKIFIGGGFGKFLDIENAITIGLFPDVRREKFVYLGNTSLMGAYMALVSRDYLKKQLELRNRMTYIELSTDPAYMNQYTAAMFLPHTEKNRFPSVIL